MRWRRRTTHTRRCSTSSMVRGRCLICSLKNWTALVLYALAFGVKRHGELKREITGISQNMLTRTLRNLERDGLVKRTVYHVVPPRVEYTLTPLGETFSELLKDICTWAETHFAAIEDARVEYDHKAKAVGS